MSELIRVSRGECPEFFDYCPNMRRLVIYNDGSNYLGYAKGAGKKNKNFKHGKMNDRDKYFNEMFIQSFKENIKKKQRGNYLLEKMIERYPNANDLAEYTEINLERKLHNVHKRLKRFNRKVSMNRWSYMLTASYSDSKIDGETTEAKEKNFKKKLRKCLSNLATRHGWRYMGVWERGEETNRLHFHALLYVPAGEMLGILEEKFDYDKFRGIMQSRNENSFFEKTFGRNDFKIIDDVELQNGKAAQYILKYITKDDGRVITSRGIPESILLDINEDDIYCVTNNRFVLKYILYDDVINWERDVKRFSFGKQMAFADLSQNSIPIT